MRAALLQQTDASIRWKKPGTIFKSRYAVPLFLVARRSTTKLTIPTPPDI
jgi:hypothetical protein